MFVFRQIKSPKGTEMSNFNAQNKSNIWQLCDHLHSTLHQDFQSLKKLTKKHFLFIIFQVQQE